MLKNTKSRSARLGIIQAASEYGLRSRTIHQWIRRGHFKANKHEWTRLYSFKRTDFEAFLKKDRPVGRPPKKSDGGEKS